METSRGDIVTRRLVSCGGLHADRVASMDSTPEVAIIPFRGDYYTLTPEARHLCRGLIYPVPDPSLPFLGVHFTKRFDGAVWAGPNAVLATAREGYRRRDVNLRDLTDTVRYPGFSKLARRWWKTGAQEIWRDVVKATFVKDLQKYVPAVKASQLVFGPSGVRARSRGSGRLPGRRLQAGRHRRQRARAECAESRRDSLAGHRRAPRRQRRRSVLAGGPPRTDIHVELHPS